MGGGVRKEAVMGWQDARDSWGMKPGGGRAVEDGGRRSGARGAGGDGCVRESGPERQVRRKTLGCETHFPTRF